MAGKKMKKVISHCQIMYGYKWRVFQVQVGWLSLGICGFQPCSPRFEFIQICCWSFHVNCSLVLQHVASPYAGLDGFIHIAVGCMKCSWYFSMFVAVYSPNSRFFLKGLKVSLANPQTKWRFRPRKTIEPERRNSCGRSPRHRANQGDGHVPRGNSAKNGDFWLWNWSFSHRNMALPGLPGASPPTKKITRLALKWGFLRNKAWNLIRCDSSGSHDFCPKKWASIIGNNSWLPRNRFFFFCFFRFYRWCCC